MDDRQLTTHSPEVVLRTIGLGKRYGRRWAVNDLSLEVHRGEIFGFLGPNGAGKSTTIRMLLSLVRPTEGHVELFGQRLDRHRASVLRRVGGLVEQADFYLYLTARRNLEIVGALYGGVPRGAVGQVLETVGLADRAADKVKTFSHGMRQRLGIAQALLSNPEIIVLDEPTTGLDPQGIVEVRDLIMALAHNHGITVFLSSHLLSEIEQTATSMAIINNGRLIVQGPVQELLTSKETVLRIEARPIEQVRRLLNGVRGAGELTENAGRFQMAIETERIPAVTKLLVENGAEVFAVTPRRSLEDYFLKITEEASQAVRPHRG